MIQSMGRNWWVLALRGLLAIVFAVLAFLYPGVALLAMVTVFGAYAFVDGILAFVLGYSLRKTPGAPMWLLVLEGVVGVLAGLYAWFFPITTAVALLYLAAAWAIVTGVLQVYAAIRFRKEIHGEWLFALGGIASVILGVLLVLLPAAGLLFWVLMTAGYALFYGFLMILMAYHSKKRAAGKDTSTPSNMPHGAPA
ncbi:MAG: hypothetical protein QOJ65_594 [Fimbriimonadaceae bacterium]|jgi:uncharacterized membrane protein HdeD (DUF308 family)|nr:hypothetical protein [Fimbriimonadaceae bacterium]